MGFLLIISGTGINEHNEYLSAKISLDNLYKSKNTKTPVENITLNDIEEVKIKVNKLPNNISAKKNMQNQVVELEKYTTLKREIENCLQNDKIKNNISEKNIASINQNLKTLSASYKNLLKEKIEHINKQYKNKVEIKNQIDNLYTDTSRKIIKEDISRDDYEKVLKNLLDTELEEFIKEEQEYLNKIEQFIISKEKEETAKKAQQIVAAWTILNVPYISQNNNNILNGCEAASLLMALQYKGYLKDVDLRTFAENMPKSTDPFQGFTYDIYGLQPTNVPHWIAPKPLAEYGKNASGNKNIIDATGYTLEELDKQIQWSNPVVIYLTSNFKAPKEWIESAPQNIHVLLLTGYNSITEEHIITDPWTGKEGKTKWQVSKAEVENIFNQTGQRAVIIK